MSLLGRSPVGGPLRGHGHAHFVPLELGEAGRLDHVLVWAPDKLDARAQRALASVTRTWAKGVDDDIVVTCCGLGDLRDFERLRTARGRRPGVLGVSRQWVSRTPFVPPRHVKRHRHTIEDQVRAELASRGLPAPEAIELLPRSEVIRRRLLRFVRRRQSKKPQPPAPLAVGLRLVFAEPVRGPLCLGYASHFGLGCFEVDSPPGRGPRTQP